MLRVARPSFAVLITLLASSAPAAASPELGLDLDPRVRLGGRVAWATASAGRLSGGAGGVGLAGSVQIGGSGVSVAAELDALWGEAKDEASEFRGDAALTRARLMAQLPFLEYQTDRFRGGLHLVAGMGSEWIGVSTNDAGGERLRRDMISWGLEAAHGFAAGDRSIVNVDLGWRIDLAKPPDGAKLIPGCTGPCSMLSPTEPIDLSLTFALSLRWGPIGPARGGRR